MAKIKRFGAIVAIALIAQGHGLLAQEGDGMAGRTYALQHCSECHNVGAGRQQPIRPRGAPDFQAVADAPTTTMLGLEVFLTTTHANMPNFVIVEGDRQNIITYILSLRRKGKPGRL